jgi:hypothetical protein
VNIQTAKHIIDSYYKVRYNKYHLIVSEIKNYSSNILFNVYKILVVIFILFGHLCTL